MKRLQESKFIADKCGIVRWNVLILGFFLSTIFMSSSAYALGWMCPQRSMLLFGGVLDNGSLDQTVKFCAKTDSIYLVGISYDTQFIKIVKGLTLGGEVGIDERFGDGDSAEFWGGPSLRYNITICNIVTISLGFTGGLSAVTDAIGMERVRERYRPGDATLLFYFGPEVGFQFNSIPRVAFVLGIHHRSGAAGTLGNMGEGINGYICGIRYYF